MVRFPAKWATNTRKKRTWARQKGEGLYPSNAQPKEEMKCREHEPKSPYVFHSVRVKHPPKHTVVSYKLKGNNKGVKARIVTDLDGSRVYTL